VDERCKELFKVQSSNWIWDYAPVLISSFRCPGFFGVIDYQQNIHAFGIFVE
jgi:hypothetical protein